MLRAVLALGKGADRGHAHIGELYALDGIPVGISVGVQCRDAGGIAQHCFNAVRVLYAGGHIGAIPYTVLLGVGKVIFINVQRTHAGGVNRGLVHGCGKGCNRKAAHYQDSEQQRKDFLQNSRSSFRFKMM